MRRHLATTLLVLTLQYNGWVAPSSAEDPDLVELTFAWPDTLTLAVETEFYRITAGAGGVPDTLFTAGEQTWHVRPTDTGFHITTEVGTLSLPEAGEDQFVRRLLEQTTLLAPDFAVDRSGSFQGLVASERFASSVRTMFEPLIAPLGPLASRVTALLDHRLEAERLSAAAAREWEALVGLWADQALELGAPYSWAAPDAGSHDQAPSRLVTALERLPCANGTPGCVSLRFTDDAGARRSWARVVTAPETLIPSFVEVGQVAPIKDTGQETRLIRRWFRVAGGGE